MATKTIYIYKDNSKEFYYKIGKADIRIGFDPDNTTAFDIAEHRIHEQRGPGVNSEWTFVDVFDISSVEFSSLEVESYIHNELEKEFGEKHNFQTSVRGIKVRGVFPTQQEAELRCKMLRQADPNHDVYVGPVGIWVPFHPEAYKTGRVEYMEETLNELMSEKKKNENNVFLIILSKN